MNMAGALQNLVDETMIVIHGYPAHYNDHNPGGNGGKTIPFDAPSPIFQYKFIIIASAS